MPPTLELTASPNDTIECRVMQIEQLSPEVTGVRLEPDRRRRFEFNAGQYIDILLSGSAKRSFSLANAPRADGILELHIRNLGGSTQVDELFDKIRRRETLRVLGPYGRFTLANETPHSLVFIAGGTGIAPVKAMLEQAFTELRTQRMLLFWGVRRRNELYMHQLATHWMSSHPEFDYVPILSDPAPEDDWSGATGFVHETALQRVGAELATCQVYASGPPPMVHAVRDAFIARGLPQAQLHSDLF